MQNFFAPYRTYFVCAAGFSLVINLLMLLPALYMLQVFDRVLASRHEETLLLLTGVTLAALLATLLLDVLRARLLAAAATAIDQRLGPQVLRGLLARACTPRASHDVDGLKDLATLRGFLTGPAVLALFDTPWLPLYLVLIFFFHPLMGAVACGGALALVLLALAGEWLTCAPLLAMQAAARRTGRFVDMSLRNAELTGALGMAGAVVQRWQHGNQQVLALQARANTWALRISAASKCTRQVVQVAMLAVGAWLVISADVAPGVMLAATILLGRALAPVDSLIGSWRLLVQARAAAGRLQSHQQAQQAVADRTALPAPTGAISAERLVFAIEPSATPILKGVSWALAAGESMAVVGPSAAGKSTLVRLIVGVWKAQRGALRLDGAELSQWTAERLGPHIGYLPQDVELFDGTVRDNIARMRDVASDGTSDSAAADEAVVAAAQAAFAHELIVQLPQGYDTPIGEAGHALSGGQRQRIALARALYGAPCIVVLDEPNASLDCEGEEALMRCLQQQKAAGTTLIVITHRPAIIASLDRVLVLRDGAVELFAPRDEFMAKLTRLKGAAQGAGRALQRVAAT